MNDYMLEEMAETIAKEMSVDHNDVLRNLHRYWADKIAPVWQADDVLEAALNIGKPITRQDAVQVLKDLFEGHDAELGITWMTLDVALQEYHLNWKRLPEDRYEEVQGVFKVWRKGDLIAHQVGLLPEGIHGNLPKALTLAKSLADETPGVPILIGCEPHHSDDVEDWLSVTRQDEEQLVTESGEACTL
ncbi:MAG TPA: hypothetical protein VJ972_14965 [Anaerolineales bacterium]|nr:hypothetical protein [Anaerolineales bacterium]